jgi:hypothetical protein
MRTTGTRSGEGHQPSIPGPVCRVFGGRGVLFERVNFVADFERYDVLVDHGLGVVIGSLCHGGESVAGREPSLPLEGGQRVDSIAVDDERQRLPHGWGIE